MNENQIRVYDTAAAEVSDANALLDLAEQIRFSTVYPGGIFDQASFYVPCDVTRSIPIKHGQRVAIRNGLTLVWEGFISNLTLKVAAEEQGVQVEALGFQALAQKTYLYHRYIDRRYSSDISGVWAWDTSACAAEKCTFDQNNRLQFVPKNVAWGASEPARFLFDGNGMGNTTRVTFTYAFNTASAPSGLAYKLELLDRSRPARYLWSTSTTGSGTADISLAASTTDALYFTYRSNTSASQQPPSDGNVFARITNLALFGEDLQLASQTTVQDILKSLVKYLWAYSDAVFSSDTTLIGANAYDMTAAGFVCDDLREPILQIMNRVGTFSASNLAYSAGIRESEAIPGNTKPVVYYEPQPAVTDYEYVVRLDEQQLEGIELVLSADPNELVNRIWVVYTDTSGKTQWVNHADDSRLSDGTSRAKYLGRQDIIQTNQVFDTYVAAADYGTRFVNAKKNLAVYMRGPLVLKGTVRKKDGSRVPVSQIRAGQRVKIENWLSDVGDVASSGLTFLISRTEYDDDAQSNSISCGVPDDLATYLARLDLMNNRYL